MNEEETRKRISKDIAHMAINSQFNYFKNKCITPFQRYTLMFMHLKAIAENWGFNPSIQKELLIYLKALRDVAKRSNQYGYEYTPPYIGSMSFDEWHYIKKAELWLCLHILIHLSNHDNAYKRYFNWRHKSRTLFLNPLQLSCENSDSRLLTKTQML